MINAAIIGAGNMGALHGKLLSNNKDVNMVGIVDVFKSKSEELAHQLKTKVFDDVDKLLEEKLDIVFVTVPNTKHAELTIKGLKKGVNVFCEKPLATSLEDAREVINTSKNVNKQVFIGLNRRFAPVYLQAKKIINEPGFKATNINMIQNDADMINPPWLTDISMTGGFMYDTTVHFLDMAEYLMGSVVEVRAFGKATFYPIMDDFVIQMKFSNGSYGVISTCGHASGISPFERIQVIGNHKSFITEELDSIRYSPGLGKIVEAFDYSKLEYQEKWGYSAMHKYIFSCLGNSETPINSAEVGYKVVELIESCHKSAKHDGEIIKL
jgi:myo-inositol 2-dehydrogenase/D-chiro-inositol 1-dehydrogenase